MAIRQPEACEWNVSDDNTGDGLLTIYSEARDILVGMARAGNVSSRHHLEMLVEVEMVKATIPGHHHNTGAAPATSPLLLSPSTINWACVAGASPAIGNDNTGGAVERLVGFDDWASLARYQDLDPYSSEMFQSSGG